MRQYVILSHFQTTFTLKMFNFQALNHLFNNENVSIGIYNKYFRCLRRGSFVITEILVFRRMKFFNFTFKVLHICDIVLGLLIPDPYIYSPKVGTRLVMKII